MAGRITTKLLATCALVALCASALVLTAAPAGAAYRCAQSLTSPIGDTPNEATGGEGENIDNLDIVSAGVVADDGKNLRVGLALKDLSFDFPSNATSLNWFFQWTHADVSYYARASVSAATPDAPTYVYGTYNPTTSAYTSSGSAVGGSFMMGKGGQVEIEVPYEGIGAPTAGQSLNQVFAITYVGQGVPGGPTSLVDADRGPKAEEAYGADYTLGACSDGGGTLAAPRAGLGFDDKTPKRYSKIVATATLKVCGDHAGTRIQLQQRSGGSYKKVASKRLGDTCRVRFTVEANFKSAVFRSYWPQQDENHRAGRSQTVEVVTH